MGDDTSNIRSEAISFGKDYEYLIPAYYGLVFSLNEKITNFKLSTNNKEMEDFDDVVVEIEFDNGEEHVFALQLKHINRQIAQITLLNKHKNFGLKKYKEEFVKIKSNYEKTNSFRASFDNLHLILFTTSALEKRGEFNTEWKKLQPEGSGIVIEEDIFIRKNEFDYQQELLGVFTDEKDCVFRFKTIPKNSSYEEFFEHFCLYTKQKNAKEMERLIADTFKRTFRRCDSYLVINYLNYFQYWCRGDYGAFKLTKRDICMKIAELVLIKYIPEPIVTKWYYSSDRTTSIIKDIFLSFDVVIVDDQNQDLINRIWSIMLLDFVNVFQKFAKDWSKPISNFYMRDLRKQMSIPISCYSENFNEMSLEKIYLLCWHTGLFPLFIEMAEDSEQVEDIVKAITLARRKNPECKFILLDQNKYFKGHSSWKILRTLSDIFINNLSLYYALEELTVCLQGRSCSKLKELFAFDDRLRSTITTKEIIMISKSSNYSIGKDCKKHFPPCYIYRSIPKLLLDIKVIEEVPDLFVVSISGGMEIKTLTDSVDLDKYLLLDELGYPLHQQKFDELSKFFILAKGGCSKEKFEQICFLNQKFNCHHVRLVDENRIEWLESKGSIEGLRIFQIGLENLQPDDVVKDEDALMHFHRSVNIICADSGMGKTIFMKNLHHTCSTEYWVIQINIREHLNFFKESHDNEDILNHFIETESCGDHFIAEVINIFASKKRCLFLWDGFDEISSDCVDFVVVAIKQLAEEGYGHWLSSRNHSKKFLEDSFHALSLTLTRFTSQNQYDYVYYHLMKKYGDTEKVNRIIDNINETISVTLNCGYTDYTGTPLLLHILTEIYLEDQKEDPSLLSLTDMYKKFIMGKFDRMFEKAEADLENVYMQEIREHYIINQMEIYETAAVKTAFEKEYVDHIRFNFDEFLNELEAGEDMIEVILGLTDDKKILFAHKTYEEFLAASWLSKNYQQHQQLVKLLFEEKYSTIRLMFDMLLAENSPVHLAVLYKNLELLRKFSTEIDNCKDKAGRNPLHVICTWGRRHPLIKPMDENEEVDIVERSKEKNYEEYLHFLALFKRLNLKIKGFEEFPFDSKLTDQINDVFNKLYAKKDCGSYLPDEPNSIRINLQNLTKIDDEESDFYEILQFLLKHGCQLFEKDDLFGWNPFQYADYALCLSAIDVMMQFYPINLATLQNFNHIPTIIHYSVNFLYKNLLEAVEDIPYVEYRIQSGRYTLLQMSVENNNLHAVSKLLQYPYYRRVINVENACSGNTLLSAAFRRNTEMIRLLLKNGADLNAHKKSPLVTAVWCGHIDSCKLLLEAGAEVNAINANVNGYSPIIAAASADHIDIMRLLLENGADVNFISKDDYTALEFAVGCKSLEMVRLLLRHKPNLNRQRKCSRILGYTPLHEVAEYGHLEIVKCLLEHGADASLKNNKLLTPLHIALYNKHKEVAIELIKAEPRIINDYDDEGLTPVMLAAVKNFPDVIKLLAEKGADLDCSGSSMSPLCYAATQNLDSCVQTLIEGGASVNKPTSSGLYPLMLSVKELSTVKLFLSNGADVNAKFNDSTVLHFAIMNGKKEAVELLLNNGASVNGDFDPDVDLKKTPICRAIQEKQLEIMEILLGRGAEFGRGSTLINQAIIHDFSEAIPLLVEKGVEVNKEDDDGFTPLSIATSFEVVQTLLKCGADPDIIPEVKHFLLITRLSQIDSKLSEDLARCVEGGEEMLQYSPLQRAAFQGNLLVVASLIAYGANVNITNFNSETPLHCACSTDVTPSIKTLTNRNSCVEELIKHGAVVNCQDKKGLTPLHLSCHKKLFSTAKLLVEHGADVNILNGEGSSALHVCYAVGEFEIADFLLSQGAKLDVENAGGMKPLDYAMELLLLNFKGEYYLNFLEKLIKLGADINHSSCSDGSTLLHKATASGRTTLVDYLLQNGANVDCTENTGYTPLFYACFGNYQQILLLLLEKNCSLNIRCKENYTPLHYAVALGFEDIVRALIDAGGDVNASNYIGNTPLHLAVEKKSDKLVKFLIQAGAEVDKKNNSGWTPLFIACENSNLTLVKILHENGASLLQTNADENLLTASYQSAPLIKYLVDNGADVNQKNQYGCTPLYNSVSAKNYDGALYLLENGAEIDSVCRDSLTPINCATRNGNVDIVTLLLSLDANVMIPDSNGKNCIATAVVANNLELLELYADKLQEGRNGISDRNELDDQWKKYFHYAAYFGNLEIILLIYRKGLVKIDVRSEIDSCTALHYACLKGHSDVVKFLIENGADVNVKSSEGITPIYFASMEGHFDLVKFLTENGAAVDLKNNHGNTPLFSAAARGFLQIVRFLFDKGADINVIDEDGDAPLHDAATYGYLAVVEFLVSKDADINRRNKKGETPLDLASAKNHTEVENFLRGFSSLN